MAPWSRLKSALAWISVIVVATEIVLAGGLVLFARFLEAPAYITRYSGPPPWFTVALSQGSGFFLAEDGSILPGEPVVHGCRRITVAGYGLRAERAVVVARHPGIVQDMAVIRIRRRLPAILPLLDQPEPSASTGPLSYDAPIRVLGFPTSVRDITPISVGVTRLFAERGMDDASSDRWLLGFLGSVRKGNSGSPILDADDHVIGIVSRASDSLRMSRSSGPLLTSGVGVYGGYLTGWLRMQHVHFTLAGPGTAPVTPTQAERATVRVFCFGGRLQEPD